MRYRLPMLILLLLASTPSLIAGTTRLEPDVRVVPQRDAPVKVTGYKAHYQEGSTYTREGIAHSVEYQNVSGKPITAVQIGLVSFDVWNEFLDQTNGVSTDALAPQAATKGLWVATAWAAFSFHTGVAYVSKVRFATGEIWKVDLGTIGDELRKIQTDFDVTELKKKEPPR